jgi:phosphoglycolate phosphatase-like HAD superfamily hydrolase
MRENTERWMELCAQAAHEQDPQKLMALVNEILALLKEKEHRLGIVPSKPNPDTP